VKIGHEAVDRLEAVTRRDEDRRIASERSDGPVLVSRTFEQAERCRADGDDLAAGRARRIEPGGGLLVDPPPFGYDDAVYAGARLIEIVSGSRLSLAEMLGDLPATVFTPEIRLECPDSIKFEVAERARDRFRELGYDIVDVDGVRVKFDDGWGLIRASNTQPVLVTRFESESRENLEKNRATVEAELEEIKRELAA